MPIYQIKIVIPKAKTDEFLVTFRALSSGFRKNKGCIGFDVYQGLDQPNTFCIIAELTSSKALQEHFRNRNFKILLGAARTLGIDFKMTIANEVEKGNFELAKSKIRST